MENVAFLGLTYKSIEFDEEGTTQNKFWKQFKDNHMKSGTQTLE